MAKAEEKNMFFLLDSGEGRDFLDPKTGLYLEDLSGWYVNIEDREKLLRSRNASTAYEEFSESYVFAIWSLSDIGDIQITFKKYD